MSTDFKIFRTADDEPIQVDSAIRDGDGKRISTTYEKLANKVTSINVSSTDIQYPSAKAVYSLLNSLILEINSHIMSYSATMELLNSVIMPEESTVADNNVAFPENVTISNHNINL